MLLDSSIVNKYWDPELDLLAGELRLKLTGWAQVWTHLLLKMCIENKNNLYFFYQLAQEKLAVVGFDGQLCEFTSFVGELTPDHQSQTQWTSPWTNLKNSKYFRVCAMGTVSAQNNVTICFEIRIRVRTRAM